MEELNNATGSYVEFVIHEDNVINRCMPNNKVITLIDPFSYKEESTDLTKHTDLKEFSNIEKLTIENFYESSLSKINLKHPTLKAMTIINKDKRNFTSLEGIHNFPELETLVIVNGDNLSNDASALCSCKHKIKEITVLFNGNIWFDSLDYLKAYCQINKISFRIR